MVTLATSRALVVVFAPRAIEERALTRVLDVTAERMHEFTGGREAARLIG
jgi:DNA/RNA-binding domain of Phe-tRNA-synthetase-like protein